MVNWRPADLNPIPEQIDANRWDAIAVDAASDDERRRERAEVAIRDHRLFGTDPSWFGY